MDHPGRPLLLLALLVSTAAGAADSGGSTTTYRWVDAQGVVHYSDTPQPGAERLQIQPAQTFSDQALHSNQTGAAAVQEAAPDSQACAILQPASQQSFYAPDTVVVSVQLAPRLRPGEQLTVRLDGKTLRPADDTGLDFQVDDPDRGEHTVQATVRDADGRALCQARPVVFYVQRPSLLSPLSPSQGHSVPAVPSAPTGPTVPTAPPLPNAPRGH